MAALFFMLFPINHNKKPGAFCGGLTFSKRRGKLFLVFRNWYTEFHTPCVQKSIYSTYQKQLEALLRQVRLETGLTQKQLAERLDTPHSRISDYERGVRRLDLIQLRHYCEAVGLSLREFVNRFEDSL